MSPPGLPFTTRVMQMSALTPQWKVGARHRLRIEGQTTQSTLQGSICLGSGRSYGNRSGACSLNREERQIMQSDGA